MSYLSAYTDQHQDIESDLMYYNSRYYDPELKRFTSVDPWQGHVLDPQTFNKYSYVMNNPVKYNDPTGNCAGPFAFLCAAGALYLSTASYAGEDMVVQETDVVENAVVGALGGDYDSMGTLQKAGTSLVIGVATANPTKALKSGGEVAVEGSKALWKQQQRNQRIQHSSDKIANNLWRVGGRGNHGTDHRPEFASIGLDNPNKISGHLQGIMKNPDYVRHIDSDRSIFVDYGSQTVIIRNLSDGTKGGSAYIRSGQTPQQLKQYADGL